MKILSEERLIELLGDFDKKIRLELKDSEMTVNNNLRVIEFRVKKQELKLGALITMAEVNSDFKVPCKKQTLNEYLEDLIK